ncbi:AsnC family protein [Sphingomonas sp. I4]
MDDKDRQIIAALQANGRLTNQELSEQVNLSPSPACGGCGCWRMRASFAAIPP